MVDELCKSESSAQKPGPNAKACPGNTRWWEEIVVSDQASHRAGAAGSRLAVHTSYIAKVAAQQLNSSGLRAQGSGRAGS